MQKLETVGVDESDFGEIEYQSVGGLLQDFRRQVPELVDPLVAHLAFEPEHHRAVNVRRLNDPHHSDETRQRRCPPSELV